jgi:hypothetical protein
MKKSSLYGLLATAVLLVGVLFLIYCGPETKVEEGTLAGFCLSEGSLCDHSFNECCRDEQNLPMTCKAPQYGERPVCVRA